MDGTGDGRGALAGAGLSCGSCGTELPPNSKFCNECGAPVTQVSRSAEYKQVTVLFADLVIPQRDTTEDVLSCQAVTRLTWAFPG
ncbi:MAG: zinc ribbon domain-containing protein [Mycobacterium sp.]